MASDGHRLDIEVVLVCDAVSDEDDESFVHSPDGDRPTEGSLELIRSGLERAAARVVHYRTLREFMDNIGKHRDAVVFPYWFGSVSRNRHSLLPAICEAYDVCYVGADAYTKNVCNDKMLSKSISEAAGFRTSSGFTLTCADDLRRLADCEYPRVVKPNWQGSSLGIDDDNLVRSPQGAQAIVERTARHFGWPVLCEEFIPGREISVCVMGDHDGPPIIRAMSWIMNGDRAFLDDRLFSYSLKYIADIQFESFLMDGIIEELRGRCERLFNMLDKVEIMRIDGRMASSGFVVIELSPDLDLRPDGEAATVFAPRGDYRGFLATLLTNSLKRAGRQAPVRHEG